MGAGSTVFAKNVIGDTMLTATFHKTDELVIALYDIDGERLKESFLLINALNNNINGGKARIEKYLGVENRKAALKGADFVVNAIQVGLYDPCTIIDFEVPKKYGLYQTIGDTLGVGGIFRGMRTIHVLKGFAADMAEVCPDAWFLNYTNPMAILAGYMQRFTPIKTVGLCHSVQVCSTDLLTALGMEDKVEGHTDMIAGINHIAWLLDVRDKDGVDLYPEIKLRVAKSLKEDYHRDMVRYDYIMKFGYYCTESSIHNSEYSALYLKPGRDDLMQKFNTNYDEYPKRCRDQIAGWNAQRDEIMKGGAVSHEKTHEYASNIMDAMTTGVPYIIGGNVINTGLIDNLPAEACVEVPCLINKNGVTPTHVGKLPTQLAAMNSLNIYPQLLTIEAAATGKRETLYQACMMDPHTASVLSTDEIVAMCDELIETHTNAGYPIF